MRPRYLLLHRRTGLGRADAIDRRVRQWLPERRSTATATLFTSAGCPLIEIPAIGGWLVGSLYTADGRHRRTELARHEQLAIMSSGGRTLVEQTSGAYMAFWQGCGDGPPMALRDPSACLTAFAIMSDGDVAIASDIESLLVSGLIALRPDPAGLARHMRFPLVPDEMTCLAGVRELMAGARTVLGGPMVSEVLWHPRTFAERREADIGSIALAVDGVVQGQRVSDRRVGIELSGGLDSSIVAAAMTPVVDCAALHMVPAARDGDERHYARPVADLCSMRLHEVPIGFDDVDMLRRPRRLTARPTGVAHFGAIDRKLRAAQIQTGSDTLFSGAGGDSVFCSIASTGPVLDAYQDGGLPLARSVLADVSAIAGVTQWEAARSLTQRLMRRRPRSWTWPADDRLLGSVGRTAASPDAARLAGLRAGSRAHVASVLRMQMLLDTHDRMSEATMCFPLMAQPVLEACLAIPSWRWMRGGRDRAAAREAFVGRVPEVVLRRRGKGRYDTLLVRAFERARADMRELLLGGWLAEQRIIDAHTVAETLEAPVTSSSSAHSRIITLVDSELWCRMILDGQGVAGAR